MKMEDEPRKLRDEEIENLMTLIMDNKGVETKMNRHRIRSMVRSLRKDLSEIEIRPSRIPDLGSILRDRFLRSHAEPGEMVGITCAQSIGERQTQMSVAHTENVWIHEIHKRTRVPRDYVGAIGDYVDRMMTGDKDGVHDTSGDDYDAHILAISPCGTVRWSRLTEVSRHRISGRMRTIETMSGAVVSTTMSHSLLVAAESPPLRGTRIEPIVASAVEPLRHYVPYLKSRVEARPSIMRLCPVPPARLREMRIIVDTAIGMRGDVAMATGMLAQMVYSADTLRACGRVLADGLFAGTPSGLFMSRYRGNTELAFLQMIGIAMCVWGVKCDIKWTSAVGVPLTEPNGSVVMRRIDTPGYWQRVVAHKDIRGEEYERHHDFVYDLSVEEDTFMLMSGIFVHNTLNTFHSAGLAVQTVLSGVPRFMELLNATKEPRLSSTRFRLLRPVGGISECRDVIRDRLVCLPLIDLVESHSVFSQAQRTDPWFDVFEFVYNSGHKGLDHGVRMVMRSSVLHKNRLRLDMIAGCIESRFEDVHVVFSPQHLLTIDVYVDMSMMETDHDYFLRRVFLPRLFETEIGGIRGVTGYVASKDSTGTVWIQTTGNNFLDLLALEWVDQRTMVSNNMWDTLSVIGIEATRMFLLEEFGRVISSDGNYIHPNHIMLLVDIMTFHGTLLSISRYGMKKEQTSPLAKASFEECFDHFLTAGFMGETEEVKSVSASIICGRRSQIGTGICDLMIDRTKLNHPIT